MKSNILYRVSAVVCALFFSIIAGRVNAQTYCTPTFFQGCILSSEINDFSISGDAGTSISDLGTGCSGGSGTPPVTAYRDMHSSMSVTMAAGGTYTVVSNTSATSITTTNLQIFIDFNDDGTFDPSTESVGGGAMGALGASTNFTITIPVTAASGIHRMRAVSSGDATYPSVSPCPSFSLTGGGTSTTGEVHDYDALISGTVTSSCDVPTGLSATGITSTSAILNWSEPVGSAGSEYVVTTTPGTPTGPGTQTTALTYSPTGLIPSSVYYASVRDSCGPGSLSAWVTITFTTTATTSSCGLPTGLAASSVTSTSAILNWSEPGGTVGSEYVVTTTPGAPAGSGTQTTALTATPTGLTPSTVYYASVRDSCATDLSAWVTITFTTTATSTGISNTKPGSVSIVTFPNPVKNELTVNINGTHNCLGQLQLMDISGKLITTIVTDANASVLTISMSGMPSGIYFLRYTDAKHTEVIKINKQ